MPSTRSSAAPRAAAATGRVPAGGPTPITRTRRSLRSIRPTSRSPEPTTSTGSFCNPDGCDGGNNILPMSAASNHPGGVNVGFADGSVHFIKNSISSWNSLGITRVPLNGAKCADSRRHPVRASGSRCRRSTAARSSAPTPIDPGCTLRRGQFVLAAPGPVAPNTTSPESLNSVSAWGADSDVMVGQLQAERVDRHVGHVARNTSVHRVDGACTCFKP